MTIHGWLGVIPTKGPRGVSAQVACANEVSGTKVDELHLSRSWPVSNLGMKQMREGALSGVAHLPKGRGRLASSSCCRCASRSCRVL